MPRGREGSHLAGAMTSASTAPPWAASVRSAVTRRNSSVVWARSRCINVLRTARGGDRAAANRTPWPPSPCSSAEGVDRHAHKASHARVVHLCQQRMVVWQLMRVPGREPMPNALLADLVLRHRRNEFVVHQQSIDVQRLVARR